MKPPSAGTLLSAAAILLLTLPAYARDPGVVRQFKKLHPCPQELIIDGRCRGIVDHKVPLCIGGPDAVENMQWQSKEAALAKDKIEWQVCRLTRELGK